jgi:ribosomal protein S20
MTLQTDLQDAVTRVESDSQILHNVVHGNDQTTVNTENGSVKSAAKTIKDIEDTIQSGLTDIGAVGQQLNQAIDQAETYAQDAQGHAQTAQNIASSLSLPSDLTGQAGKLLAVNETEDGYEPIASKAVFYGLRREGSKLVAETGEGTFDANQFPVWMVGLPGMNYAVNENGHLLINI